ncbi:AbrB/MazE/SpoVT family DNA-binding domain-containing protein [archaeon]|nr:AbrB/MazE/SpoVT family DNA-binding domain-containing protein [archaeon]
MKNRLLEQVPKLTRVSSKGQLVIPKEIRRNLKIKEGDVFATTSSDHNLIILKKIRNPIMRKDLIILKEVEEAWKEIEEGRSKTMKKEEFLKEFNKW